jgi:penicillin-binding protein 1C
LQDQLVGGKMGTVLHATVSSSIQEMVLQEMKQHAVTLADNQIMNAAVMITEVETGNVVAYVGNNSQLDQEFGGSVNCIRAGRSTGSVLKPLLYAKSLEDGLLTPRMLLSDIPSRFGSFSPSNFSGQFEGAIPANKALSRSLNIPMVHLLKQYGLTKFHHDLQISGFKHVNKPAKHYGLSLILGGAEASLWEVNSVYTRMAQLLATNEVRELRLDTAYHSKKRTNLLMDRAAIYTTFEALVEVNRPDEENNWKAFESSQKIAWKTGTSFGFRDAWAVGVTPKYVVSVWVGNADGEGRPALTGVRAAAPLMFAIFRQLPASKSWFKVPHTEMMNLEICKETGHVAGQFCTSKKWEYLPKTCAKSTVCPYHQLIHLDKTSTYRVTNFCEEPFNMVHESWFVLPPMMERYYKANHPNYRSLPDYAPACKQQLSEQAMAFLYPKPHSKIYIPIEIAGERGKTVFEVTHRRSGVTLFWHMDDQYIGSTNEMHQLSVQPSKGKHVLTIVDENGIQLSEEFEVL